jgi:hypothetical protein
MARRIDHRGLGPRAAFSREIVPAAGDEDMVSRMNVFGGGDPIFDTKPRSIAWFMGQIEERKVALPDFQRDFVWDPADVRDLLVSMICRFPAGALLTLAQNDAKVFKPRAVSGAPRITEDETPSLLVLDGQQRLTSLYQAHRGVGDARYLVHLKSLVDSTIPLDVESIDFDEVVSFETVKKNRTLQSDSPEWQYENWVFPVHQFLTQGFDPWLNAAVAAHGGEPELQLKRRVRLGQIRDALLGPLGGYNFPVVELPEDTSLVAVCKIFETLNLRGIKLSVFELITARVWPFGQDLRQLWADAKKNHPILVEFGVDPYNVLQAITLRSRQSAQRSAVLELSADEIREHWEPTIESYAAVLELVRDQLWVQAQKWLPYTSVLIPMAASWNRLDELSGPAVGNAKERLRQFFWCSVFMATYDQGGNSQAQADYGRLDAWLLDPAQPAPEAVTDFSLTTTQLANAKRNRRALYRGVMALVMHSGALDFHQKERITAAKIVDQEIDAHHLFPRNWLEQNYFGTTEEPLSEELLPNFALVDSLTNKLISDRAPSDYLAEMADEMGEKERDRILQSHVIGSEARDAMLRDDYEAFVAARTRDLGDEIRRVTGQAVADDQE